MTYETVYNAYSSPLNMGITEIHNIATIVAYNIAIWPTLKNMFKKAGKKLEAGTKKNPQSRKGEKAKNKREG